MADLPYMSHNTEEDMSKKKTPEKKVFIESAKNAKWIAIDTFIGVVVLFIIASVVAVVFVSRATKTRVSSNLPQLLHPKELARNVFIQFFSQITKPTPGNCLVVEERYCNGQLVSYKNKVFGLGFSVSAGTPLFAPDNGLIMILKSGFASSTQIIFADTQDTNNLSKIGRTIFLTNGFKLENKNSIPILNGLIRAYLFNKGEEIGVITSSDGFPSLSSTSSIILTIMPNQGDAALYTQYLTK